MRLARIATDQWMDVEGYAIANGVGSLRNLTISEFCSFVWHMVSQGHEDETSLEKTRARIWQPPKGKEADHGPWSREAEMQSFDNLKAQLGL